MGLSDTLPVGLSDVERLTASGSVLDSGAISVVPCIESLPGTSTVPGSKLTLI